MKYYVITSNPRFRNVFSGHLSQKKIIYKIMDKESEIIDEISSRGRKTIFLDHDYADISPENIVQLAIKNLEDNIVITFGGEKSKDEIVALFRAGIKDIFVEPFMAPELIDLAISIKKDDDKKTGFAANPEKDKDTKAAPKQKEKRDKYQTPIGASAAFKSLLMLVERVSKSDATIIVTGESGTGKEVLAQYIHSLSQRGLQPFVPVNCGAIPENLLESEFFGHVKGAFTGAFADRKGRFEMASSGSIFLDEISELPLHLQVKLLRVLQEKEIQPVGSNEIVPINPRIIVATNKSLEDEIKKGKFREDLFYRLNVIPVHLPPLRERLDDIPALAKYFIEKFNARHNTSVTGLSKECVKKMLQYSWPGNVRELENTLERMIVIRYDGIIEVEDLPLKVLGIDSDPLSILLGKEPEKKAVTSKSKKQAKDKEPASEISVFEIDWEEADIPKSFDIKEFVDNIEKGLIKNAMKKTKSNKNQAAKVLGLNRTTLIEKIKKKDMSF